MNKEKTKVEDIEDTGKEEFECVPLSKVPDPEKEKFRTVKYTAFDDPPQEVSLRLFGTAAQVHRKALEHLFYVTCCHEQSESVESILEECRGRATDCMEAYDNAVDSIVIGDNCPCCHR